MPNFKRRVDNLRYQYVTPTGVEYRGMNRSTSIARRAMSYVLTLQIDGIQRSRTDETSVALPDVVTTYGGGIMRGGENSHSHACAAMHEILRSPLDDGNLKIGVF